MRERLGVFVVIMMAFAAHVVGFRLVGDVASTLGVDYAAWVQLPLDAHVPYVPPLIVPYTVLWLLPPVWVLYLLALQDRMPLASIRRVAVTVVGLMASLYLFYLVFPVSVRDLRLSAAQLGAHGWYGELTLWKYGVGTPWNAFPSSHCASAWMMWRILAHYRLHRPARWAFGLMLALTAMATVTMRTHFLLDIVGGIAFAEAAFRGIHLRLDAARAFEGRAAPVAGLITGAFLALIVVGRWLHPT